MVENKNEKRAARRRKKATGESYCVALMHVRRECRSCREGRECAGCAIDTCGPCLDRREAKL